MIKCTITYIPESRVQELLTWNRTFEAVERAMASVSNRKAVQPMRSKIILPSKPGIMFMMPGYLDDDQYGALAYKEFTVFPNTGLIVNLTYLDDTTGEVKAIISGDQITRWRTAAASVIATKYIHGGHSGKQNNILAILGAGGQGKTHAVALQLYFNFREVRIWNRTLERAQKLVEELNKDQASKVFSVADSIQACLQDADVIVTATNSMRTLVKSEWLKKGCHINAVGVNPNTFELEDEVYKTSNVYVDYWDGANAELFNIKKLGVEFKAQIGDLMTGSMLSPNVDTTTVFQSLGMAVEDCAMARLVYDAHMGKYTKHDD